MPTTSFATRSNEIRTRFSTLVEVPENLPTGYDNDLRFTIPETGVWARVSVVWGPSSLQDIGSVKRTRNSGTLHIELYNELGRGDKSLLDLIDFIVPLFRSKDISGILYRDPEVLSLGQGGKFFRVDLLCPFEYDDFETNP